MKVVDVNILLSVVNPGRGNHTRVLEWWEQSLVGDEPIGLAWPVVLGFIRISTNPKLYPKALTWEQACRQVEAWLSRPHVRLLQEREGHWAILKELLSHVGAAGNLTPDAHLAALAMSHGATLVSADTDFSKFPRLRWENPLEVG